MVLAPTKEPKATRQDLLMQEGPNEGDITDDDYRMTAELRGLNYGAPGSIAYRVIFGDGVSRDGDRDQHNFDSTRWYSGASSGPPPG